MPLRHLKYSHKIIFIQYPSVVYKRDFDFYIDLSISQEGWKMDFKQCEHNIL